MSNALRRLKRGIKHANSPHYHPSRNPFARERFIREAIAEARATLKTKNGGKL